jgi:hypothetical protein
MIQLFALFRKNKMEIELAESKFELLELKSQLMDAIQQKMALSQELEQWQVRFLTNTSSCCVFANFNNLLILPK